MQLKDTAYFSKGYDFKKSEIKMNLRWKCSNHEWQISKSVFIYVEILLNP